MKKGVAYNTNSLVEDYYGKKGLFFVQIKAFNPPAPKLTGKAPSVKVELAERDYVEIDGSKDGILIMFKDEAYSVSHGHSWDEGGTVENMLKSGWDSIFGKLTGGTASAESLYQSLATGSLVDQTQLYAAFDVQTVYKSSAIMSMEIPFVFLNMTGDRSVIDKANALRDLTYPTLNTKQGQKTTDLYKVGKPPVLFEVKCTNGAQSLKEAACTGLNITYHGPWLGEEGYPSYADVTMKFESTRKVIFADDFKDL
jgi:hypothetical protein